MQASSGTKRGRSAWLASGAIVASASAAAALALLPAVLLGLVLLLRYSLGPASVPFGLTFSVIAWIAPDWSHRVSLLAALLQGIGPGLAFHILRLTLVAAACLAPAVSALFATRQRNPTIRLSWLLAGFACGMLGWTSSSKLVDILLTPALILSALRAFRALAALRPAATWR